MDILLAILLFGVDAGVFFPGGWQLVMAIIIVPHVFRSVVCSIHVMQPTKQN